MLLINTFFNFNKFLVEYKVTYPLLKLPSVAFLQWFIGFSEGDCSFTRAKRNDLYFVITQSTVDVQVLYYIKNNLGFGSVVQQSKKDKTHRFIIQDLKHLYLICLLFNGNMILPIKNAKFLNFLTFLNEKLLKRNLYSIILPNYNTLLPTLTDAWLAGFVDAEGCFHVRLYTVNKSYKFLFSLTQKWDQNKSVLLHILKLFNYNSDKQLGKVIPHSVNQVWDLRIAGLENCQSLFHYFDSFPLKSKKLNSYLKWKNLHSKLLNKDHLDPKKRIELIRLSKDINLK